jgi:hypothetical protein
MSSLSNINQILTKNPRILSGRIELEEHHLYYSINNRFFFKKKKKKIEKLFALTVLTTSNLLPCSRKNSLLPQKQLPPLKEFIHDFYKRANLPCAVHLFTLIYLLRLKSKLPKKACGGYDTPFRIFLAAVLTSSKYLSETGTELNSTAVSHLTCQLYTPKDISQMERSFLVLMRYNLWVSLSEIESFFDEYSDSIHVAQLSVSDNNSSNSVNGNHCLEDVLLVTKSVLPHQA